MVRVGVVDVVEVIYRVVNVIVVSWNFKVCFF